MVVFFYVVEIVINWSVVAIAPWPHSLRMLDAYIDCRGVLWYSRTFELSCSIYMQGRNGGISSLWSLAVDVLIRASFVESHPVATCLY